MHQRFIANLYSKVLVCSLNNNQYLVYRFSQFKTKILKVYSNPYNNITQLYQNLNRFQKNLRHVQKIKYYKQVKQIQKKIKKISKKENKVQNTLKSFLFLDKAFDSTISHQIFYHIQSQQYKPINQQMSLNIIELSLLFQIVCKEKSMFYRDFQRIHLQILSNPLINQEFYKKIKERCTFIQQQLCLNVFQHYDQVLKQNQYNMNIEAQNNKVLNKLVQSNTKGRNKQTTFTQDFKFTLNLKLTSQQNFFASQINKTLVKYGFSSQKGKIFALKSLSNQGHKALTPSSLKNHLFVLAHFKHQIIQLNEALYKVFEIFCNNTQQQCPPQYQGHIGPFNSLLFYVLSNKIQNYQLLKSILQRIVIIYKKRNISTSSISVRPKSQIQSFDKQLYCIMLKLLKVKYQLSFQNLAQEFGLSSEDIIHLSIQNVYKNAQKVNSNSSESFQKYLTQKDYKYQKQPFDYLNSISEDTIIRIQDKKFICLHLSRININNQKPNGIGELILDYFKKQGEQIKIINPLVIKKCQKWNQKKDYFKSKLKGIPQPQKKREKRFNF